MKVAQTKQRRTISFLGFVALIFTLQAAFVFSAVAASAEAGYLDQKMGLAKSVSLSERSELPPIAQASERTGLMGSLAGWGNNFASGIKDGVVGGVKYVGGKVVDGLGWTVDRVEDAIDLSKAVTDAVVDILKDAAVLTKELVVEAFDWLKESLAAIAKAYIEVEKAKLELMGDAIEWVFFMGLAVLEAEEGYDKITLDAVDIGPGDLMVLDTDALIVLEDEIKDADALASYLDNAANYASDHYMRTIYGYGELLVEFDLLDLLADGLVDGEVDRLRNFADQHAPERMDSNYVNPCLGAMYAQLAGDCYEINSTKDTNTVSTTSNGWEIIEVNKHFFSDFEAVLYKNIDKGSDYYGEYVLAFRGTESGLWSGSNDWYADIFGNPAGIEEQYIEAAQYAMELQTRGYGNLKLVGHSLGGGLAQYASYQTGLKAITYNAADPGHWIVGNGTTGYSSNITNYRYYNDPLSALNIATSEAGLTYRLGSDYYLHGEATELGESHGWKNLKNELGKECGQDDGDGDSNPDDNGGIPETNPANPDEPGSSDPGNSKPKPPWTVGTPPGWVPPSYFKETYEKKDYQDTFYKK